MQLRSFTAEAASPREKTKMFCLVLIMGHILAKKNRISRINRIDYEIFDKFGFVPSIS